MSSQTTSHKLDIQYAFAFPFKDPNWAVKLLIGTAIILLGNVIPVLPWLVILGYCIQMMKGVIRQNRLPFLPEWDNWEEIFMDGLQYYAIYLIFFIPVILLILLAVGLNFFGIFAGTFSGVGAAIAIEEGASEALVLIAVLIQIVFAVLQFAVFGLVFILGILESIILPVPQGHFIATGKFSAAFLFSTWWQIFKANFGGFLLVYVIIYGINFIVSMVIMTMMATLVLCVAIPFIVMPLGFYLSLVRMSLLAQAYRTGAEKAGLLPPIEVSVSQ